MLSAKRKHFPEKLSKCNSSKPLYGLTNELLGNSKSSVFPSYIPESELRDNFSSFSDKKKIASVCTEYDSQPAVDTYISHSFVGSELCSFEPVSQEFVRKLTCDFAPNSWVLDPIPIILLKIIGMT